MLKRIHIRGYKSLAEDAPALVGFEEPENGVHPRRIRLIAELLKTQEILGQTQHIVTTHSPLLPDLLADDCLYAVRRLNRETHIDPFATSWGPLGRGGDIDRPRRTSGRFVTALRQGFVYDISGLAGVSCSMRSHFVI